MSVLALATAVVLAFFQSQAAGEGRGGAPVTLTRTADGVSIYRNQSATYYISDRCRATGTSTDSGASIGPAYIYRVDYAGDASQRIMVPRGADVPPTGLGAFVVDVYQGRADYRPSPDGTQNEDYGRFESIQGNVCLGDAEVLTFASGSGVADRGSTRTDAGTSTSSATYLWAHYAVRLADPHGDQFEVTYQYRFYPNDVRVWTTVRTCPNGVCHTDPAYPGGAAFVKMPKFVMVAHGPANDYTSLDCRAASGEFLASASQVDNPNGSTIGNHCHGNGRDYARIAGSASRPSLNIQARSQASASFGPSYPTYPWEAPGTSGYGIDKLAGLGAGRVTLPYANVACPGGGSVLAEYDGTRNWEMFGDDGSHAYGPYNTKGIFFKGWEDGNGPPSCPSLYHEMVPNESFANYFKYWFAGL